MAVTMVRQELAMGFSEISQPWQPTTVRELGRPDQDEVLEFLSARPIHTVFMAGLIHDNGILSPRNRGSFYGARSQSGYLEGVALIGHATLVEAHTEGALIAFARVARNCHSAHLIRGEVHATATFWQHFAEEYQEPRRVSGEHLFEICEAAPQAVKIEGLRTATDADLDKVVSVNAALALEEGGVSPLQADPTGFRARTTERVAKDRVWVLIDDHRLIFKADVVSQTPDATYLEGIYVNPEERRKGYGLQCLTQLCAHLLESSTSICLTVNERNEAGIGLYTKVGFQPHSKYQTMYLR